MAVKAPPATASPSPPPVEPKPIHATRQVRAWVRALVKDRDSWSVRSVREETKVWLQTDPALLSALLSELLDPMLDDLAREVKSGLNQKGRYVAGEGRLTMEQVEAMVEESIGQSALLQRLEHRVDKAGGNFYTRVKFLTREELLATIERRQQRVQADLHWISLYSSLAAQLKPGQTVGDVFSEEEVTRLEIEMQQRP